MKKLLITVNMKMIIFIDLTYYISMEPPKHSALSFPCLCLLLAVLHHADSSLPYARPPGGLPPVGGDRWHRHADHLHDVHEHVHRQRPDLWLEL